MIRFPMIVGIVFIHSQNKGLFSSVWGGKISQMSYGIYLSHFMLVSAFLKFGIYQKIPLCIEPLVMAFSVLIATMQMLLILGKLGLKKIIL